MMTIFRMIIMMMQIYLARLTQENCGQRHISGTIKHLIEFARAHYTVL